MSLSRILNDEPVDPIQPTQVPAPVPVRQTEPAFVDTYHRSSPPFSPNSSKREGQRSRNDDGEMAVGDHRRRDYDWGYSGPRNGSTSKHVSPIHSREPASEDALLRPRERTYESSPYDGHDPTGYQSSYTPSHSTEWPNGTSVPGFESADMAVEDQDRHQHLDRIGRRRSVSHREEENHLDDSSRKKKRSIDGLEPSYDAIPQQNGQPPVRRSSRRLARTQDITPPAEIPQEPTEEELQLASSDLSDCEEIWFQEMSHYYLETQKRQRQVEFWFDDSCVARNNEVARSASTRYYQRLTQIPTTRRLYMVPQGYAPEGALQRSPSPDFRDRNELVLELDPYSHAYRSEHYPRHAQYDQDNEDAAREFEESILGTGPSTLRHHDGRKREAAIVISDGSDNEWREDVLPLKRRRLNIVDEFMAELDHPGMSVIDDAQSVSAPYITKGKGRARETLVPSVVGTDIGPNKSRRKPGERKKAGLSLLGQEVTTGSAAPSIAGDMTPMHSAPPSPSLSSTLIYEIGDVPPPMKRAKKVDDQIMYKRIMGLEETQRKIWLNIARRDVSKVYKHHLTGYQTRQLQTKRTAALCSTQAKKIATRTGKSAKEIQIKAKRLMREMMVFWKKNEKEERDLRKRAEKEADNRAKEEEERREAARQARKLEFLISQTELYSHFVGNKLKTAEIEGETEADEALPRGAEGPDIEPVSTDVNFDDEDESNLHAHARRNAKEAIALAKARAAQFDTEASLERKTNEAIALAKAQAHLRGDDDETEQTDKPTGTLVDLDSDELNFQNPTSLSGPLTIGQPRMLQTTLKEYQLKGLNWLGTLYEQGINGILADEMGLGKTVQSIALLAYLSEVHDIWGPFLVVAPSSTLHNWQQELARFVPDLTCLPYWGTVKQRSLFRKFWSRKNISYNRDAPFHVLVTSYNLIIQDAQYFQRIKWQYMILDEAQNIKNSSSARWKTLLGLQCRNRLLLTGTPIQNNMQELWALLHFIMPSLFDSHDEFNEWFSKDIENAAAEGKGGSKLNERQLRRLHMILKPFMLRRVKRHVQNELGEKIELDIYVNLSPRQRALYKALRANISVAELIEKASHIGDADAARTLMNLVMQFRKVCNHPELFERADVIAPFSFTEYGRAASIAREGSFVALHYSSRSPIELSIPELFYLDGGLLSVPNEHSPLGADYGVMRNLLNIWSSDYIQRSIEENAHSPFNFVPLLGMTTREAHSLHFSSTIRRLVASMAVENKHIDEDPFVMDPYFDAHGTCRERLRVDSRFSPRHLEVAEGLPSLFDIARDSWSRSCLSRPSMRWFVPPVIAPHAALHCRHRSFIEQQNQLLDAPEESLVLFGLPPEMRENRAASEAFADKLPGVPLNGFLGNSPADQLPLSYMQVPEAKRLIIDSAKLARLDELLHELKAGGHRVLIYFQMTRMMDLMEEYLIYRQFKYMRLDGGSKMEDRRDLVMDWQTKPDYFVFILSTRAGGLGINLTAADTVIFYDHDWNPSNDAQAMDRAHRLGQTRQVTVYRLITRGTIDERIVQLARVKKDVQDIVVGNKQFTDVTKPKEIVSLLLNDDELANLDKADTDGSVRRVDSRAGEAASQAARALMADEEDDFFSNSGPNTGGGIVEFEDEEGGTPGPATSTRGKRRNGPTSSTRGGRKPGPKRGYKRRTAAEPMQDDF
ncbi:INO80 [Sanghuangporus sanghuang]